MLPKRVHSFGGIVWATDPFFVTRNRPFDLCLWMDRVNREAMALSAKNDGALTNDDKARLCSNVFQRLENEEQRQLKAKEDLDQARSRFGFRLPCRQPPMDLD